MSTEKITRYTLNFVGSPVIQVTVSDQRDAIKRAKALAKSTGKPVSVTTHVIEMRHLVTMHPDGGHQQ